MIVFEKISRFLRDNLENSIKDNWLFLNSMGAFNLSKADSLELCRQLTRNDFFEYPCWLQNDVIKMILEESGLENHFQSEQLYCLALTEKKGGSSFQNVMTQVACNGDICTARGTKIFISNGDIADHVIFLARDCEQRLNLYISSDLSFIRRRKLNLITPLSHYDLAEMEFVDAQCRCLFRDNPQKGMFVLNKAMAIERMYCALTMLEMSRNLLELFARQYKARQHMLNENSHWKYTYADMKKKVHMLDVYVSNMESKYISGYAILPKDAAIAKSFATDTLKALLDNVMALFGAQSIVEGNVLEKYDAYAKAFFNAGGTKEIMAEIIGADL